MGPGLKTYWRISNQVDLSGLGGEKYSSRWTSMGRRIVYLAESPAGAMLEILVHLRDRGSKLPYSFKLMEITAPEQLPSKNLMPLAETDWKQRPDVTQRLGDQWLASLETPLARVPSAIMPRTWNILLNPEHVDTPQVQIVSILEERFDNRLFRLGSS